mgnify:CR=1 FL=1
MTHQEAIPPLINLIGNKIMTNIIKANEVESLSTYARTDSKAQRTLSNIIAELYTVGFRATDYRSPKSKQYNATCTMGEYEARKDAIASGLGKVAYMLYSTPKEEAKGWDDTKKAQRKSVQQDVGTYIDRIANKLDKIANPDTGDKAPTPPVSDEVKMREAINKCLKIAEKAELPIYDVVAFTKALNDAQRILSVRLTK